MTTAVALPEALAIYRPDGTLLAANPTMHAVLRCESDGARLRREVSRAVALAGEMPAVQHEVAGELRVYLLSASRVAPQAGGPDANVVVVLSEARALMLSDAEIRVRHGLSRRECAVARLLAACYSNERVARTLCISPHTARHHTERVLTKLNLRSRAAIAAHLSRP